MVRQNICLLYFNILNSQCKITYIFPLVRMDADKLTAEPRATFTLHTAILVRLWSCNLLPREENKKQNTAWKFRKGM